MQLDKNIRDSAVTSVSSQDFIRPLLKISPPNQIISSKYQPDTQPQFKLIVNKDERRNNINFIPPKTKNQQLFTYANQFNMFDYLGHSYSKKINQIVYMKFNNSKYNVDPTQKHLTRIMPAFYIPFQNIYNTTQIQFTKGMGLHFPEAYSQKSLPNLKSNKGCSLDPIFNSNYQSSNLFAAVRKNPFQYDLILQNDINSCQTVSWFNYIVQFRSQGYYSFNIKNLTIDMSKLYENGMKIAYCYLNQFQSNEHKKTGEGWSFCGQNIKFIKSAIQRQNKKGETYYQLYFQYKCKNKQDKIMFAFEPSYSSVQCQKYFNYVTVKKIRNMMNFQKIQYGKTISGTPLFSYVLKRKKYTRNESLKKFPQPSFDLNIQPSKHRKSINLLSPINKITSCQTLDNKNKSIVILIRVEGSDVSGSYILQDNIEYESLKKTMNFYFIPMTNIDAVKYGNSITNLTGSILHNNWKNPNQLYQAEIYHLKEFLNQIQAQAPINLILNLCSQRQDVSSSVISIKNDNFQTQDSRIFPYVLSRRNKLFSFQKSYFYDKNSNNSMCCVLNDHFPQALIYQIFVSHFQTNTYSQQQSCDDFDLKLKLATNDSYRNFGKQLMSCYLEHIKIEAKNTLLRQKWLREIQQIEKKFQRKIPIFKEDKKIEEKFVEAFYHIGNIKSSTSLAQIKSHNNLSHKYIKPALPDYKRPSKVLKKQNAVKKVANIHSYFELNKANGYFKDQSVIQESNKQDDKPAYQLKVTNVGPKKTSILNNIPPSMINLITEAQSKRQIPKSKDHIHLNVEKEQLKKQISIRLLKKIKVDDNRVQKTVESDKSLRNL